MDILKKNIAAGMQVRRFVPSYGDKPNDVPNVLKCMDNLIFLSCCLSEISQISSKNSTPTMLVFVEVLLAHRLTRSSSYRKGSLRSLDVSFGTNYLQS
jgi:hypothetical protein